MIHLLLEDHFITLYSLWRVWYDFLKKSQTFQKKIHVFFLFFL